MAILINLLLVILVIICFLLIFVVLLQRPKSEGLGAAFGGGITDQYLGARQTDVFVRFTTWMGAAFFFLSALLAYLYAHQNRGQTATQRALLNAPKPAASVAPAVPGPSASPGNRNNDAAPLAAPTGVAPSPAVVPNAASEPIVPAPPVVPAAPTAAPTASDEANPPPAAESPFATAAPDAPAASPSPRQP